MNARQAIRDIEGRVAIVTGASSGIGRATAILLAERGARVLATARDHVKLEALCRQQAGITMCPADLLDPKATRLVFNAAEALGTPSILVCSAGLPGYIDKPIFEQSDSAWRATIAVNLDSPFQMSREISHHIRQQKWGRIVYVSSTAGQVGAASMSAYCASKHGLIGLMRSVAWDIGPYGATANAICPGWVRTDMAERHAEQEAAERGLSVEAVWAERDKSYPRGRVLSAEEVANTISFLASDQAAAINGEVVTVALGGVW